MFTPYPMRAIRSSNADMMRIMRRRSSPSTAATRESLLARLSGMLGAKRGVPASSSELRIL